MGILDALAKETGGVRQYSDQYEIGYGGEHYHYRQQKKGEDRMDNASNYSIDYSNLSDEQFSIMSEMAKDRYNPYMSQDNPKYSSVKDIKTVFDNGIVLPVLENGENTERYSIEIRIKNFGNDEWAIDADLFDKQDEIYIALGGTYAGDITTLDDFKAMIEKGFETEFVLATAIKEDTQEKLEKSAKTAQNNYER